MKRNRQSPDKVAPSREEIPLIVIGRSANWLAERRDSLRRGETDFESILTPATNRSILVAIFSYPNHPFGIYKYFQTVHIFKHYEFHVASFWWLRVSRTYHDKIRRN